ncbi:MAG: carboxylating nicotinate-nucleotide diphosphorylase [gamma proteobacterium symbiont of Taylorina sp.]|nr:carboxylating nicotinate-nucleotide diphosphorylase [gamma proteobacterium symbiont of Taylorina sp.]
MFSIPHSVIQSQVSQALLEDIGCGDVTANLIPENTQSTAHLICRENAILCGRDWFNEVFRQLDHSTQIQWQHQDGDNLSSEQRVCTLTGNSRSILTGERTAMNFLQTLSGTASTTHQYVARLNQNANINHPVKLLDTRKTIPGLREAQKYAVRCGGGYNHRHGLFDGILIKENHIMAAGSISNAVQNARQNSTHTLKIEVEIETLEELQEALEAKADILLLDNMSDEVLAKAVKLNQQFNQHQTKLEVSGNITLARLNDLANIGIDYISSGAITKNLKATDFSLRFEK